MIFLIDHKVELLPLMGHGRVCLDMHTKSSIISHLIRGWKIKQTTERLIEDCLRLREFLSTTSDDLTTPCEIIWGENFRGELNLSHLPPPPGNFHLTTSVEHGPYGNFGLTDPTNNFPYPRDNFPGVTSSLGGGIQAPAAFLLRVASI